MMSLYAEEMACFMFEIVDTNQDCSEGIYLPLYSIL
jgi:hypothetical protein